MSAKPQNVWRLAATASKLISSPLLSHVGRLFKLFPKRREPRTSTMTIPLEWRGLSYPIGGDEGAITVPNILTRWTNVTGQSHTPSSYLPFSSPPVWRGGESSAWVDGDENESWSHTKGLNGAVSGAKSSSLVNQVRGELSRRAKEKMIAHSWCRPDLTEDERDGRLGRRLEICKHRNRRERPGASPSLPAGKFSLIWS